MHKDGFKLQGNHCTELYCERFASLRGVFIFKAFTVIPHHVALFDETEFKLHVF